MYALREVGIVIVACGLLGMVRCGVAIIEALLFDDDNPEPVDGTGLPCP